MTKMPEFDDEYTGQRFTYGLTNRPVGAANIPDGWIINSDRTNANFRHGTIDYDRELTDAEIAGYELHPVFPCTCYYADPDGNERTAHTYHTSAFEYATGRCIACKKSPGDTESGFCPPCLSEYLEKAAI